MDLRFALPAGLTLALLVACSSDDPEPNNGVNDVRAACALRASWANKDSSPCLYCRTAALAIPCECSDPVLSKCHEQQKAVNEEPQCSGVDACVRGCNDDCACIDRCYADRAACYRAASAVDGCVADLCDSRCK